MRRSRWSSGPKTACERGEPTVIRTLRTRGRACFCVECRRFRRHVAASVSDHCSWTFSRVARSSARRSVATGSALVTRHWWTKPGMVSVLGDSKGRCSSSANARASAGSVISPRASIATFLVDPYRTTLGPSVVMSRPVRKYADGRRGLTTPPAGICSVYSAGFTSGMPFDGGASPAAESSSLMGVSPRSVTRTGVRSLPSPFWISTTDIPEMPRWLSLV